MIHRVLDRRRLLAGAAGLFALTTFGRAQEQNRYLHEFEDEPKPDAANEGQPASATFLQYKFGDVLVTTLYAGSQSYAARDLIADAPGDAETVYRHNSVIVLDFGNGQIAIVDPAPVKAASTGEEPWLANFRAAGLDAKSVVAILFSNLRGEHINVFAQRGDKALFPNARAIVGREEWQYWTSAENAERADESLQSDFKRVRTIFDPIRDEVLQFAPDTELVTGLTSILAPGYTPGHSAFLLKSRTSTLLMPCEAIQAPQQILAPDMAFKAEMDAKTAEQARRMLLEEGYTKKHPVAVKHAPLPNIGRVVVTENGPDFELLDSETPQQQLAEPEQKPAAPPTDAAAQPPQPIAPVNVPKPLSPPDNNMPPSARPPAN